MQFLCRLDALSHQESRGFELGERSLLAVRIADDVYVYENHCPHRGVALEWTPHQFLDTSKHFIQCATHGALFQIHSGRCIAGPCLGDSLRAVAVTVLDGAIFLLPDAQ